MKYLIILLALLSALTLAYPSNISARDDDLVLIYCDDKNFYGHCDYGKYDRCTPLIMVTRSLSVQEGYQCVLYDGPECRATDVSPRYVGDRYTRKTLFNVDFRIMSVVCRSAPLKSARAVTGASPSTLSARVDKPPMVTVCPSKTLFGDCISGDYIICIPMTMAIQSLKVRPGQQCAFYPEPECKGVPRYIGDNQVEVGHLDVDFPIASVICRPFDPSCPRSIGDADGVESRSNIESRADIDSPTDINADWSLTICGGKDFQGSCDSGYYESCTGVGAIIQVQSLSVREGIDCEFYAESACRTNTGGLVHVGDRQNRVNINSVQFPVRSFKCHHFALRREASNAAISERKQTMEICREGDRKCTDESLQSSLVICVKGAWRPVQTCASHELCVKGPEPHCAPR